MVSALTALEDKLMSPDERIKCHGSFEIGGRRFKCTKTHGVVSLYEAIVQSCNVYFYDLGARPGMLDRLNRFATDMGLGAPTGLGLNGEESGFMPNEEWYREQKRQNPKNEGFQVGHALNAAIGQGSTRVTLLQMAAMYAAIANGGKLWLPQIVERIESPTGRWWRSSRPGCGASWPSRLKTWPFVRQALVGVVNEPKGTAYKVRLDEDLEVAGKTGTAQVRRVHAPRGGGHLRTERPRLVRGLRTGRQPARRLRRAGRARRPRRGDRRAAGHAVLHDYFENGGPRRPGRPQGGAAAAALQPDHAGARRARPPRRAALMALRSISWRKLRFRFDWTLTFAMFAIIAVGLVNLWSAVHDRSPHLFSKQVSLLGRRRCACFWRSPPSTIAASAGGPTCSMALGVAMLVAVLAVRAGGGRRAAAGSTWAPCTCSPPKARSCSPCWRWAST